MIVEEWDSDVAADPPPYPRWGKRTFKMFGTSIELISYWTTVGEIVMTFSDRENYGEHAMLEYWDEEVSNWVPIPVPPGATLEGLEIDDIVMELLL